MTQLVARVSLPAFSRIQDNPEQVRRGAELTLKWNAIVTLPAFAALIAFGPEVASLIYGEQWLPAVPALYIFVLNSVLVPINGLITPILIAIGKTRVVLTVAVVWAIGAWVLAVGLMTAGVGFLAVPIALAVSQAVATMVLVPIGRREFELRVVRRLVRPFVAAVTAGVFGRFVLLPLLTDAVLLVQGCVVVAAVYLGVLYLIDRRAFQAELGSLRRRDGIGASS
jgi:O-antigen/teichoic acid export membrane protein